MTDLAAVPVFPDWLDNLPAPVSTSHKPPTEVANRNVPAATDDLTGRARHAVGKLARELAATATGQRNALLNKHAHTLAGLVAAGAAIERAEVESRLRAACEVNGALRDDGVRQFEATFKSGWESGLLRPMPLDEVEAGPGTGEQARSITATPFKLRADPATIPRREWLYGDGPDTEVHERHRCARRGREVVADHCRGACDGHGPPAARRDADRQASCVVVERRRPDRRA